MTADSQLAYEARVRPRHALVAVLAAVLLVGAAVAQLGGPHTKVNELTLDLLVANQRFPLDLIASIVNGVATLLIAWTLVFLYDRTRARTELVKPWLRWVAIGGGILSAFTGIAYAAVVAIKVHEFATTGAQTYDEANRLTSSSGLLALQLLGQAAALLMALAFVLVSLNAMRNGLLTKFMGYMGIFAGVLTLFAIIQIPVVQGYWLAALAYLLSGRWPTGVPPAWASGRSEPWPSAAEMRQRAGAGGRGGRGGGGRRSHPAPIPEPATAPAGAAPRPGAGKRKRKRRS